MNHRERVVTALSHKEPDRVPYDLGAHGATGIHYVPYEKLRKRLGLPGKPTRIWHLMQQLADVDEDMLRIFDADARRLDRNAPKAWKLEFVEADGARSYKDEFGIEFRMPLKDGFYYDPRVHPLASAETAADVENFPWPDATDPARYEGIVEQAKERRAREGGCALTLGSICPGPLEMGMWLRGFDIFFMDLVLNPDLVRAITEKITEFKIDYWNTVLPLVKDYVDVVGESDDLGGQNGTIISLDLYRQWFKPRHIEVTSTIRKHTDVPIFFHSCGSIYDLIPDFIESGWNIINPVQVSAAKMDTKALKRDFGKDISFWGGGCDTQRVLSVGTRQEIRDEVKRRIDDLAPGGGFVFTPVHNIQADVPSENIVIMLEAFKEFCGY